MVAAWMRAETGVGPSMASGSQMWSGNCADLPAAPAKRQIPAKVRSQGSQRRSSTLWKMAPKSSEPTWLMMMRRARKKPTSPTRVVRKALMAAFEADFFSK
jgi:hypothetical protein